jgi:hypothetical protein
MDAMERSPGDAEAAAAVAGMAETYGHGIKVGAEHWFQPAIGAMPIPGRVLDVNAGGMIVIADRSGTEHIIHPTMIAEF